jgi:hypothetical protein
VRQAHRHTVCVWVAISIIIIIMPPPHQVLTSVLCSCGAALYHACVYCLLACADGNLAAVLKERQQVQAEVWAEATPETVRDSLAKAFPDLSQRTIVTLNNLADPAAAAAAATDTTEAAAAGATTTTAE